MAYSTNRNIRRKIYIFFNCVIVSAVVWLLTVLSQQHTDTVNVAIRYVNIPENLMVVNRLPQEMKVMVQARGFRLLVNRMRQTWSSLEVKIDPGMDFQSGKNNFQVLGLRSKYEEIASQLGNDVRIQSIEPDSIFFRFDLKAYKKVPVRLAAGISFRKQYGQSGPIDIIPDSVIISGGEAEVERTDSVVNYYVSLPNLSQEYRNTLMLKEIQGVTFSSPNIDVTIPVEQVTEKQLEMPVRLINVPDDAEMKIFPEKVKVTMLVPLSQYNRINAEQFTIEADYNRVNPSINKIILRTGTKPVYVSIVSIQPGFVEYIIRLKR